MHSFPFVKPWGLAQAASLPVPVRQLGSPPLFLGLHCLAAEWRCAVNMGENEAGARKPRAFEPLASSPHSG